MLDSTFDSTRTQRRIGRFAWAMAWFGLVAGQLHAMARHQTTDGKEDLQMWTTRVWSDPGRKLFAPLLAGAARYVVSRPGGKIWPPVAPGSPLCAFVMSPGRR